MRLILAVLLGFIASELITHQGDVVAALYSKFPYVPTTLFRKRLVGQTPTH